LVQLSFKKYFNGALQAFLCLRGNDPVPAKKASRGAVVFIKNADA